MRRHLLILVSLIISLVGCSSPFLDLRETVCIVRDKTDSPQEWLQNPRYHAEMEDKVEKIITDGINMWFQHIPEQAPAILIMGPNQDNYCSNPDIRVKVVNSINKNTCAKVEYNPTKYSGFIITLATDCSMNSRSFAHEFGHILWDFGHVFNRFSVMTTTANSDVTPKDMEMMCAEHPEITCPSFVWCQGTFYNKDQCPSTSPDDMVILYKGMYGQSVDGQRTF